MFFLSLLNLILHYLYHGTVGIISFSAWDYVLRHNGYLYPR